MSRDAFVVELAGLKFKISGTVRIHDRPPVEDLEVKAIFADEHEAVLVDLPEAFLQQLWVYDGIEKVPLEKYFADQLVRMVSL